MVRYAKMSVAELVTPNPGNDNNTPLHHIVWNGKLHQISEAKRRALTVKHWVQKNNFGDTPLHGASEKQRLNQIPEETLKAFTIEHWVLQSTRGDTPFFWAARRGQLDRIPESTLKAFTLDHWLQKDGFGDTPVYWAAWGKHLDQVLRVEIWQGRYQDLREIWKYLKKHCTDCLTPEVEHQYNQVKMAVQRARMGSTKVAMANTQGQER